MRKMVISVDSDGKFISYHAGEFINASDGILITDRTIMQKIEDYFPAIKLLYENGSIVDVERLSGYTPPINEMAIAFTESQIGIELLKLDNQVLGQLITDLQMEIELLKGGK